MNLRKPMWATAIAATFFVAAACGRNAGAATPGATAGPGGSAASAATRTSTLPPKSTKPTVAATPAAAVTATPAPTTATRVYEHEIEPCTLLDEGDVQALTGESANFTDDGGRSEGAYHSCFWGATTAGVPGYVQLDIERRPNDLESGASTGMPGNWDCTAAPVGNLGTEAVGGTCVGSNQTKVFLTAWDEGVRVTLYVNEPKGGLEPEGIAPTVRSLLELLTQTCAATFC